MRLDKTWLATIGMLIAIPVLLYAGNFSLNGGEQSSYDGDKTITGALTVEGAAQIDGGLVISASGLTVTGTTILNNNVLIQSVIRMPSKTEAQLKALSPVYTGTVYYDSTNKALVLSTGTAVASFGLITDGTSSPTGW